MSEKSGLGVGDRKGSVPERGEIGFLLPEEVEGSEIRFLGPTRFMIGAENGIWKVRGGEEVGEVGG